MLLPQGQSRAPWTPAAIHDTVAAIARQPAYHRSPTSTLWSDLWRWVFQRISDFLDLFRGSDGARLGVMIVLVLLGLVIAMRLLLAARDTHDANRLPSSPRHFVGRSTSWADADRFAADGNFTDAAHALFAALLASLAARGELRLHSSKTSGDYARELRRFGSPAQRDFQSFRRRYDHAIYGARVCTADEYRALLSDAVPFRSDRRAA